MSSSDPDSWFDRFADGMKEHEESRTSVPLEGTDLGRYQLEKPLGEGSFAIVFRAHDKELNRTVAVKVLKEIAAMDSTLQKRFFREAQVVARISHPNVVTVHDVGTHENTSYLVMEYVEGLSLASALQKKTLDLKEKVEIVEKIAFGLQAAHEEGIIHRDLKPANILLTKEGSPKIADFGLAQVRGPETRLTRSGATLGTPAYMAPEQVKGDIRAIGPKTDLYALGIILYEMITGQYAHIGKTPVELYGKIMKDDPVSPRKIKGEIPPDLETICLKAMDKSLHRRYDSAGEFAEDLIRYQKNEPIIARPPSTIYKFRKALWKRRLIALPTLAASVVLILALTIFLPQLKRASREKGEARQRELLAKQEQERTKQATAQKEKQLNEARPYLGEARKIRERIDRQLGNPKTFPESIQKQVDEAVEMLNQALRIHPDYGEAHLELGRLAVILGESYQKVLGFFDLAIDIDPNLVGAYLERVQVLLVKYSDLHFDFYGNRRPTSNEGNHVRLQIEQDLQEIRNRSRDRMTILFAEGILLFTEQKYARAAEKVAQYAEKMVSQPWGWLWLANIHLVGGKPEEAKKAAETGLGYRPWNASLLSAHRNALIELADIQEQKGNLEKAAAFRKEALENSERMVSIADSDAQLWSSLGQSRAKTGDLAGAIKAYTKALSLNPDMIMTRKGRGTAYARLGNHDKAIEDFSGEIRINPADGGAYFNRALVYANTSRFDLALADLNISVEKDPDFPDAWAFRAQCRARKGDFLGALEDAQQGLSIAPKGWKYRPVVMQWIQEYRKELEKE